jgi:hypothetical protein
LDSEYRKHRKVDNEGLKAIIALRELQEVVRSLA